MSDFYVYEHWRPDTNQCFYVGKGKGRRANKLHDRNDHHKAIVTKLAKSGQLIEVRMVISGLTEEQALIIEISRIGFWRLIGAPLVNMTAGGDNPPLCKGHSKETRRKIGEANKRRVWTEETKNKFRAMRKDKPLSEEHRAKISAAGKGRRHSESTLSKLRNPSEETRKKLAAAARGRYHSAATRAKIGAAISKHFASRTEAGADNGQ